MRRLLLLAPIVLGLLGCSGTSGVSTSGSASDAPPKNLSGYVHKGIMQDAAVRIIGINSLGQMDRDDAGVVAGPISYTGIDGRYISAINGDFTGQVVAMVRPRFKDVTCTDDDLNADANTDGVDDGCLDIYGKIFEKDSTAWPNPAGEILTSIICDSHDGCLAPTGNVAFGETYKPSKDFLMLAAVNDFQDGQVINVTPITHIAAELANTVFQDAGHTQGVYTSRTIQEANSLVANLFFEPQVKTGEQGKGSNIDIVALRPADLRNVTASLTASQEVHAIHYALANAAIERLTKDRNASIAPDTTPVTSYLSELIAEYKSSQGLSASNADEFTLKKVLTGISDELTDLLATGQFISSAYTAPLQASVNTNSSSVDDFDAADKISGNAKLVPANTAEGSSELITLENAKLFTDSVTPWMSNIDLGFKGFDLSNLELGCSNNTCIEWPELIGGTFAGINLSSFTSDDYAGFFNEHVARGNAFDLRARPELTQMQDKVNALWILAVTCAHGGVSDLTCVNNEFLQNYSSDINSAISAYKGFIGNGLEITKAVDSKDASRVVTSLIFTDVAIENTKLDLVVTISDVTTATTGSEYQIIYEGTIWYGDLLLELLKVGEDEKISKVDLIYQDKAELSAATAEPQVIDYIFKRFNARLINDTPDIEQIATSDLTIDGTAYLEAELNQRLVAVKSFLQASSEPRYNVASGRLIGKFIELDAQGGQEDIFSVSLEYSASNTLFYYPNYVGDDDKFPPLFNFFAAPDELDIASEWADPDTTKNRPLLTLSFKEESRPVLGDSKWVSSADFVVPGVTDQYRLYKATKANENHRLQVCRKNDDQNNFSCGVESPLTDEIQAEINTFGAGEVVSNVGRLQKLIDYLRANDSTGTTFNKLVVTGFGVYKIDYEDDAFKFTSIAAGDSKAFGGALEEILTIGADSINVSFSADLYDNQSSTDTLFVRRKPLFSDYRLKVPAIDLDEELATDDDADNDATLYSASYVMGYDISIYEPSISPIPAGGRSIFMSYSNLGTDGISSLEPALGSLLFTLQDKDEDDQLQVAEALVFAALSDEDLDHSVLSPVAYMSYRGQLFGTVRTEDANLVLRYTDGASKNLPVTQP